ncbi:YecA family protein [Flavobacterium sp. ZB4R12]|uniref:YecA family protein n=1 Tax=Flavobacterium sp. ZB4R12 TaxID=3398732 RepID=UPI003AACDE21
MKAEEFWDVYMNSTENTLDIYDEAMVFFSEELPENFTEEYDVTEVVLEVQGHHETAKKFEKVINFVNLIKEKHPEIYEETSVYSNNFLTSYYGYQNDIPEIEKVFEDASKNVEANYDQFLSVFKTLLFYQHINIVERAVDANFEAVSNCDTLIAGSEYDLIIIKLFNSLEKHYLASQAGIVFEKEKVVQDIQKYTFDFIEIEQSITLFEKGLFEDNWDAKSIQALFLENKSEAYHILQAQFIKEMLQKNICFAVSSKIWELLMRYWRANNEESQNHFAIETQEFDKFLQEISGGFFSNDKSDKYAILWGSVYVYDFLFEKELIDSKTYSEFIATSQELKGVLIANEPASLWEFNFVHKWQKPDGISEIEFETEAEIFNKSLTFDKHNFSDFKPMIASELETIGELSVSILKGEAKIIEEQKKADERLNYLFGNSGANFVEKPIVKELHEKIGRNDPCHCGSGKKFKKCCLN